MKRFAFAPTLLLAAALLAGTAHATTPGQINYQGLLLDSQGHPVTGNVDLVFTIFDAPTGGVALWTETHPGVAALDGVYDVVLGTTTPITPAIVAGGALYLQIRVGTETLSPRQRLVAVPYALRAAEADSVGGFDAGYVTQLLHNFDFDGGAPANDDPREGLADVDGDGRANFLDADNDGDGLGDTVELGQGSNINLITPTIAAIAPAAAEASVTTHVTVTGTNFEPGLAVSFGSQTPSPQSVTPSSFGLDVGPQPAGTAAVQVTRTNGEHAQASFSFVENQPVIQSFSPPALDAQQSALVTVTGTGFAAGIQVEFGNATPAAQNVTATSFGVTVGPQPAGAALVRLSYPSGHQTTATYEFVDAIATPKKVFTTSTSYNGNLGGIPGADAKCAARAAAASLSGTYKAWLGDSATSPNASFTRGVAYYLVDGTTRVAQSYADLTDATLENAIAKNEFGSTFGGSAVWTNVAANGNPQANHCSDWSSASSAVTGRTGQATSTGAAWTSLGTDNCNALRPLYCFQQ
jgi:hypothetical protein